MFEALESRRMMSVTLENTTTLPYIESQAITAEPTTTAKTGGTVAQAISGVYKASQEVTTNVIRSIRP